MGTNPGWTVFFFRPCNVRGSQGHTGDPLHTQVLDLDGQGKLPQGGTNGDLHSFRQRTVDLVLFSFLVR